MPSKITSKANGDPSTVLYIEEYDMPEPGPNEALVQILAAPVNPADINLVQGKYWMKVNDYGYEGVGKVIKLGSPGNKSLAVGDMVVPKIYSGMWKTHLVLHEDILFRLPQELGLAEAATFIVNPTTVYRMLKDYVDLQPGDTVIQNGGNSACGVVVTQLCKAWGLNLISVVRDRPNIDELKDYLKSVGAAYVFTEEEIKGTKIFANGELEKPKLGLNCIGGESANNILRHLADEGVLVTYGGMSMEPIRVSTSTLVFRTVKLVGFNMTKFSMSPENERKIVPMFNELVELMLKGKLKAPPHVFVDYQKFKTAVENTLSKGGMIGKKYILDFRTPASKI